MMRMAGSRGIVLVHEFVTGGGLAGRPIPPSLAAEGHAIRRALAADFSTRDDLQVVMTLDSRLPDEPGPWEVLRVGPGEELEAFAHHAGEAHYTVLVAPETGGILFERAKAIHQVGGRSLGSEPDAIALAADKLMMSMHLSAARIPTPPSQRVVPVEGLPQDFSYPAVLKPVDGAGSLQTFLVLGPGPVPAEARSLPEAILQPYIPGTPMSASFLVGAEGRSILLGVGRQWVDQVGGRFTYKGGTVPSRSRVPTDAAQRAIDSIPGLRGWVGVDFIWEEGSPEITVLEVNPRVTTSYIGLRTLVADGALAWNWLAGLYDPSLYNAKYWAARIRAHKPVSFAADGTILPEGSIP